MGAFEVSYDLSPYAVGMKPPPRRDTTGCVEASTVPFCPVDGAPDDQGQEELRLPSMMVKTSETWNSRPVRDL